MRKTPFLLTAVLLLPALIHAQDIRATTEDGRTVILKKDGTWQYQEKTKPTTATGGFNKSSKATSTYRARGGKFSVWFDPTKWSQGKSDDPSKTTFQFTDGDLYGMIIAERMEIRLDALKEVALTNAKAVAPDTRITFEEMRTVNGRSILCMKMEGTIQTIRFVYYGYYSAGPSGTVQLLTYTSKNLSAEMEPEMTEFLNGLTIAD